jgi:hypothetical protein
VSENNVTGLGIPFYIAANLFAIAAWTMNKIVSIDFANKKIGEGVGIFGLRSLNWRKYNEIEKIFINSVNVVGQDVYSLPWSVTWKDKLYKAFLKTTDGEKILLMVNSDKDLILKKINDYNKIIGTKIFDNTS